MVKQQAVVETRYAVLDPTTGLLLAGGGDLTHWTALGTIEGSRILARLFTYETEANNVVAHARRRRCYSTASAESLDRAVIVPVRVTYEVQP